MALDVERSDELAAVALLALSGGVFWVSRDYPTGPTITPGSAFFPRLIAGGIALLAVLLLLQSAVRESPAHAVSLGDAVRVVVPMVALGGYVAAMPVVGFLETTVAFLVVLMAYSGVTRPRVLVPVSVGVGVVLQYVFVQFLRVPLPEGELLALARFLPDLPL